MTKRASVPRALVVAALAVLAGALIVLGAVGFFRDTKRFVLYARQSVDGLSVGASVRFKGIEIGSVRDVRINLSRLERSPEDLRIPVIIQLDEQRLAAEGVVVDLDDPAVVERLIASGLRATLSMQNMVTGRRHIALDMKPGTPADLIKDPTVKHPEIPVLPSPHQLIQEEVAAVLTRLSHVDFPALLGSTQKLVDDTSALVASPGLNQAAARLDKVTTNLDGTLAELRRLLASYGPGSAGGRDIAQLAHGAAQMTTEAARLTTSMNRLLQPEGALLSSVQSTLAEMQDAARSMRRLAEQIGRDPGAMVRGGRP